MVLDTSSQTGGFAMNIHTGRIAFPAHSGSGPQSREAFIDVGPIVRAVAVLTGSNLSFAGEDHHIGMALTSVQAQILGGNQRVRVIATLGLRDWSGNWDDRYEGWIDFVILSE
jgi:hypothetical protein